MWFHGPHPTPAPHSSSSLLSPQTATFRETKQITLLLDVFRAGLDPEDPLARLPVPVTLFVAHALAILLRPEHSLYPLVNRFLLQRPAMDVTDMPMFYGLFYSPEPDFRSERSWMLRLLASGLKTSQVRAPVQGRMGPGSARATASSCGCAFPHGDNLVDLTNRTTGCTSAAASWRFC